MNSRNSLKAFKSRFVCVAMKRDEVIHGFMKIFGRRCLGK